LRPGTPFSCRFSLFVDGGLSGVFTDVEKSYYQVRMPSLLLHKELLHATHLTLLIVHVRQTHRPHTAIPLPADVRSRLSIPTMFRPTPTRTARAIRGIRLPASHVELGQSISQSTTRTLLCLEKIDQLVLGVASVGQRSISVWRDISRRGLRRSRILLWGYAGNRSGGGRATEGLRGAIGSSRPT